MESKKGAGHVEAILSFIVFGGFLFFIIVIFNPLSAQIDVELIDSVYTNLQEKTKTQISSVSFSLNDVTPEIISDGCFRLNNFQEVFTDLGCETGINFIARDADGKLLGTDTNSPNPNWIEMELATGLVDPSKNSFYSFFCSEDLTENIVPFSDCTPALSETDYILGQIVKRKLWSDQLLSDLQDEYNNDYETLKNEVIVEGNDFEFTVWDLDTQTPLYEGKQERKPRATRIDSQTLGIDALTSEGEIVKRTITISVW
jgi:hypothetical protein